MQEQMFLNLVFSIGLLIPGTSYQKAFVELLVYIHLKQELRRS